jgi:hypothetical protein
MTMDVELVPIEDPPYPDLPDLQQRDLPMPTVPVDIAGQVRVQHLPNRTSSVEVFPMTTTQQRLLGADPKRATVRLVSSVAWNYARNSQGTAAPIPANVILTITHYDEIWVSVPTSTGNLTVIGEYYGD